jgi:hypothetical protein
MFVDFLKLFEVVDTDGSFPMHTLPKTEVVFDRFFDRFSTVLCRKKAIKVCVFRHISVEKIARVND